MGEGAWASGPRLKFLEDTCQEARATLGHGPGGPCYFGTRAGRPELLSFKVAVEIAGFDEFGDRLRG